MKGGNSKPSDDWTLGRLVNQALEYKNIMEAGGNPVHTGPIQWSLGNKTTNGTSIQQS